MSGNPFDYTIDEDDQIYSELADIETSRSTFRQQANPQTAFELGNLANFSPFVPNDIALPLATAVANGVMTREQASQTAAAATLNVWIKRAGEYTTKKKDRGGVGGVWDDVFGGIKKGAQWGGAALQYPFEVGQNIAGQAWSGAMNLINAPQAAVSAAQGGGPTQVINTTGSRGRATVGMPTSEELLPKTIQPATDVFQNPFGDATQFGALVSGYDPGSGWFVGQEAAARQAERAREVRGTIGGHAFTPGRGLAVLVSQPNTAPFNILSGTVDAYAAIKAPVLPENLLARPITALKETAGIRTLAGLTNFNEPFILKEKVGSFLSSKPGQTMIDAIDNVSTIEQARQLFPKADAAFWKKAIETTGRDNVRAMLEESLGLSTGLMNTRDINISRASQVKNAFFGSDLARWSGLERLRASMPGRQIILSADNPREVTKSVTNYMDWLTMLKIEPAKRNELGKKLLDALIDNPGDFRNVAQEINQTFVDGMAKLGVNREAANFVMTNFQNMSEEFALFGALGDNGFPTVFGLGASNPMLGYSKEGNLGFFLMSDSTGMLSSEMHRYSMMLPDPREVRRAISPFKMIFEKGSVGRAVRETVGLKPSTADVTQFGKARLPIVALDFIQSKLWRPWTLMTGGYATRNISESLGMAAGAPGIKMGPMHPLEWIMTTIQGRGFSKYVGDIDGNLWVDSAEAIGREAFDEYVRATGGVMREVDPAMLQKVTYQTGAWRVANRATPALYVQGVMDNIHLLANDDLARLVAQYDFIGPDQIDEIIEWMATDNVGKEYLKSLQARHSNKKLFNIDSGEYESATIDYVDRNGSINRFNVEKFINDYVVPRIDYMTGGHPELKEIIANGERLGGFTRNGVYSEAFKTSSINNHNVVVALDYSDDFKNLVRELYDQFPDSLPQQVKHRVHAPARGGRGLIADNPLTRFWDKTVTHFFSSVFGRKEAYLNRSPVFRQYYYKKIEELLPLLGKFDADDIIARVEYAYRKDFEEKLRRLKGLRPDGDGVYRWDTQLLTKEELDAMVAEAEDALAERVAKGESKPWWSRSTRVQKFGAKYVGSQELWDKIVKMSQSAPNEGSRTLEEVSNLAKSFAADETIRTFYNAAESNNFADIFRIISPFGRAWAETLKRWYAYGTSSLKRMKNVSMSVRGFRDADPEADGTGFIYTDPTTGEPMFNYPITDISVPLITAVAGATLGQMFLGTTALGMTGSALVGGAAGFGGGRVLADQLNKVNGELSAPARSLSIGLDWKPGFGPVMQILASQLLKNKPQYSDVLKFVAPYGAPQSPSDLLPSWSQKVADAVSADPENDRFFGDNYVDAFKMLYATGEYDNTDAESMKELSDKAADIARGLTMLRGIAQFVGPARPGIQMMVPTKFEGTELKIGDINIMVKDGNIPNVVLAKAFRIMQEEDYSTAVTRFVRTFGLETMMYVVGRTKTTVEGLDASEGFADWEKKNPDLVQKYRDVFGYFAPYGGDFDKEAFLRQIDKGLRERVKNTAVIQADAEAVVGKALYIEQVRVLGPDFTAEEKAALADYRQQLYDALPGFATAEIDIKKQQAVIIKLSEAAYDPQLDGNTIAEAARVYFDAREYAIGIADERRGKAAPDNPLDGNRNSDLRAYLRDIGDRLSSAYPDFKRMYDRALFNEIDEG